MSLGALYGIGVGPGDPELLTLKGLRLLRSVPLIFVPVARPGGASLALTIVAEHLDLERQRVHELVFAMRGGVEAATAQWRANANLIADHLRGGTDAAFVTEGDPMLYSTFVHIAGELSTCLPEARIVPIPGVSSINASAALAGVPLADGDQRLAILPASYEGTKLQAALEEFDTVVLLKVASVIDQVLDRLEALGLTDRAVLVSRCGWPDESLVQDVRSLRGSHVDYFSVMIVRRGHPATIMSTKAAM